MRQLQGQLARGIKALELGFVPIPYLDYMPIHDGTGWQIDKVPYRILKAINEKGLQKIFDSFGLVEPQNETLRNMTFREPIGNNQIRETKVLGRETGKREYLTTKKDPMLIGSIQIGRKTHWFLLTIWNDSLEVPY